MVDVEGREALVATISAVHEQFPGFAFRLAGPVDGHHDQARFDWDSGPDGVEAPIVGFDVAVTDGAGRIRRVHGFLDRVPVTCRSQRPHCCGSVAGGRLGGRAARRDGVARGQRGTLVREPGVDRAEEGVRLGATAARGDLEALGAAPDGPILGRAWRTSG